MADLGRSRRLRQRGTRRQGPVSPSAPSQRPNGPRSARRQLLNLPPASSGRSTQARAYRSGSSASVPLRLLPPAQTGSSSAPPPRPPQHPDLPRRRSGGRRSPQLSDYAPAFGGRRARRSGSPLVKAPSPNSAIVRRRAPQLTPLPTAPKRAVAPSRPPLKSATPRRSPRRQRRPPSTWLYAVRLLILGLGIGAIAGTLLTAFNPTQRVSVVSTASEDELDPTSEAMSTEASFGNSAGDLATGLSLGTEMAALKADITEAIAAYPELTPGVVVLDLDTGDYVDINGQTPISSASIIKVPVLIAALQAVEAGTLELSDRLVMEEGDIASGSGDMQYQPPGTTYTALETADKMITISDNTATNMLIRKLGGIPAVNRRFSQWGLAQTAIAQPLPDLEGENVTTPMEMVTLLSSVSAGNLLGARERDRMFAIMRQTVTDSLLPQGIPFEATIAHKTGDIGEMIGDVGIVDTPTGRRYAIAVMVNRPHNDEQAAELVRYISELTYDAILQEGVSDDVDTLDESYQSDPYQDNLDSDDPDLGNPDLGDPDLGDPDLGDPDLGDPDLDDPYQPAPE